LLPFNIDTVTWAGVAVGGNVRAFGTGNGETAFGELIDGDVTHER